MSDLKCNVPIVKRIPRGARVATAIALKSHVDKVVASNSIESWQELLTFTYKHLNIDKNHDKSLSLTRRIKNNCSNPVLPTFIKLSPSSRKVGGNNIYRRVEEKVSDGDLGGASRLLFSSDTIAPNCAETLQCLRDKHPTANSVGFINESSVASNPPNVSTDGVIGAIMSFKNGSSGGIDGLSPQHLKDLVCPSVGDTGRKLASSLASLSDLMLSGRVNEEITDVLYGACLCALRKKDGGIRPIAIGTTFRRMVSKLACKHITPTLTNLFQPVQLGFGSRGGCEAAVHATRAFLNNDPNHILLKVDVKNAFNSLDRGILLSQSAEHIPAIFPYLYQCYNRPSKLVYKGNLIHSAVGCQQGDPLGPAIFSLGIHPTIVSLKSKLNIWYLDDGTLGGNPSVVIEDLKHIIEKFSSLGLGLNYAKCEVYVHPTLAPDRVNEIIAKFGEVAPNIQAVTRSSLRLLGAPLLDDSIPGFVSEQTEKFAKAAEKLQKISPHVALSIIKFCLFVPQFIYALRCCPLWKFESVLLDVDKLISHLISKVLNCQLPFEAWTQASLPVRFGGLGIRGVSCVALPAYLASVHASEALYCDILGVLRDQAEAADINEAIAKWKSVGGSDLPPILHSQRQWDEPLCKILQRRLLDECSSSSERARLLASFETESGLWLNAIPSANVGTLLDRHTLSLAIGLRLGLKIVQPHQCFCGADVNEFGRHGLSCQRSVGRIPRHSALNDVIRRALASANMPAMLEPNGIVRSDGKRPDGVTLIPWEHGKCLVWDVTCVDTLAPSHVRATCAQACAAAAGAEKLKVRKYSDISDCYFFLPLGFETFGSWGPSSKLFLKKLSMRLAEATGDRRAGSFLFQRVSLAIQRGNSASILGTLPHADAADEQLF